VQAVRFVPHVVLQLPVEHTWVAVQTVPQAPQAAGLVFVLTQTPLQSFSPFGHAQVPLLQVCPPVHTLPHPPQLFGSLLVLVHAPPQDTCWVGHPVVVHAPATHASPAAHFVAQSPQCWKLCWVFTH
jgi:hypothetical protein